MLRNEFREFGDSKTFNRAAKGFGVVAVLVILFNLALAGLVLVGLWLGVKWLWVHTS